MAGLPLSAATAVAVVALLLLNAQCTPAQANSEKTDTGPKYCSFFHNREPEVQRNLTNCTWFKESSCCRQEEIDATFGRVKPLRGASTDCQRYTNYLLCYICSPDQHLFYQMESLTVCEEFCQSWFEACKTAILEGSVIKTLYENGKDFCESRRFKLDTMKNGKCYFFDARMEMNSTAGDAPSDVDSPINNTSAHDVLSGFEVPLDENSARDAFSCPNVIVVLFCLLLLQWVMNSHCLVL